MSAPRISSFCSGADCVGVRRIGDVFAISEVHRGQVVSEQLFSRTEYEAFIAAVKAGRFDPETLR